MKPVDTFLRVRSALGLLLLLTLQIALASLLSFPLDENELPAGTKINGLSAAGMTKMEAMEAISESLPDAIEVNFSIENEHWKRVEFPLAVINARYPVEQIRDDLSEILNPHWKERWLNQLGMGITSMNLSYPVEYDEERLMIWSNNQAAALSMEPKDARLSIAKGKVTIDNHLEGYVVESLLLAAELMDALEMREFDPILIAVDVLEPEITTASLGNFEQVLASYQTNLGSNQNRNRNIELGAEKINGIRLDVSEAFSFNETVGKVSAEDGYQPAPVIQNGRLAKGIGGGICQVSSTLYQSALFSGMEILERRNHSLPVGYVPLGMDATIAYGVQDFVFSNPFSFPVLIGAWIEENELHTVILGDADYDAKSIKVETRNRQVINPPVSVIEDPLLEEGVEVVQQVGQKGYRISVFRIIGSSENEVEEELISNDYYRPVQRILKIGTGEELDERKNE